MHQRRLHSRVDARLMSDSYTIFHSPKDLALGQFFDVRLLSDCCMIFHAPKTWFYARALMSGYCQTVVQSSMTQRPGFTPGFRCRVTKRQLYNLLCTRDLASFQGINALATVRYEYDLLCTKYLALSQHFNVVCC